MEPSPATIQQHVQIVSYSIVFVALLCVIAYLAFRVEALKAQQRRQRREEQRALRAAAGELSIERENHMLALHAMTAAERQEDMARLREIQARAGGRIIKVRPVQNDINLQAPSPAPIYVPILVSNGRC